MFKQSDLNNFKKIIFFFLIFQFVVFFITLFALVRSQVFDYGQYSGFGGGLTASLQQRDQRANTGPVLFPPPPGDNGQTSGVIVGASGYGFVPPNQGNFFCFK